MRSIFAVLLLLLVTVRRIRADDNDITEQPEDKLDSNLRKALLKALNDLETEDDSNKVVSAIQEAQTSTFSILASDKSVITRVEPFTTPESTTTVAPAATFSPAIAAATSPTTTTTTTEESQAKVEDLQFFAAPLVAAFTVHQDELGLPKSVEPILREPGIKSVSTKDIELQRLKALQEIQKKQEEEKRKENELKLQMYFRKQEQIRLQQQLEEKQKLLEEQIRTLQERQKQQDQYLRQQQLIHEQQRQKLLEEQKRSTFQSSFSVQPAYQLEPQPEQYVDNTLQVPTRTYQNFQKPQSPFTYQQLPVQNTPNFHSTFSNSISNQNYRPQSNRVFRHESGTGNFVNPDYNQYQQNNRFFRSNANPPTYSITPSLNQDYHSNRFVRAPFANSQLNNLLYYSGISQGKQQEDLGLISKVLAFNIRGDNYFSGSENLGQRLAPPRNYYVQS